MSDPSTIPVKPHIQQRAHIRSREEYERLYRLSLDNPEWFWAEQAKAITWFHPWTTVLDADYAEVDFAWFSGGRLNACYNCVDRHLGRQGRPDGDHLGRRRAGGLSPHHLPGDEAPRLPDGQRAARPRRQEGRPGLHLHAHDPRDRVHDAGLRPHRRHPLGGVRRLLGREPARPHHRRRLPRRRDRQRGRARRQAHPA